MHIDILWVYFFIWCPKLPNLHSLSEYHWLCNLNNLRIQIKKKQPKWNAVNYVALLRNAYKIQVTNFVIHRCVSIFNSHTLQCHSISSLCREHKLAMRGSCTVIGLLAVTNFPTQNTNDDCGPDQRWPSYNKKKTINDIVQAFNERMRPMKQFPFALTTNSLNTTVFSFHVDMYWFKDPCWISN